MRIWDVAAGYLNRQSLLGEHSELHGLYTIVRDGRDGYSRHPETRRWVGALNALAGRHALLVAEMQLRGYVDRTPLRVRRPARWPSTFVTPPAEQLALLRQKYVGREHGRIALPRNAQQLWAQHKYSVMARDPEAYRTIGRTVARTGGSNLMASLARDLVLMLRTTPDAGRLVNALEHMWGYVSEVAGPEERRAHRRSAAALLAATQALALRYRQPFLLASTALSELAAFVSRVK